MTVIHEPGTARSNVPPFTLDPITLAVVKNSLEQITDEMDVLLYRAAFSTIISEGHDACHGLYEPDTGETIVQGKFGLPIFVGVMRFAVKAVIDHLARSGRPPLPGDLYILNDPHLSGTHMQDMKLVRPFFYNDKLFCWMAGTAHWTDVGGNVPGGFNSQATEAWQEGVRVPPVKLYSAGQLNQDILDLLLANSRTPVVGYGDLSAQINALETGEKRLAGLLDKYTPETVRAVIAELNRRSDLTMRAHISKIPDGTYSFEDYLDNDGVVDAPLKVAVDLTVQGDEMLLDFSRSSPPCQGPLNAPLATTVSSCYIAIKHIFTDVAVNSGCFRPVKFKVPEATFLNAGAGKAMNAYTEVTPVIIGVIWGALGQAAPELANACYFQTVNSFNLAGTRDDGRYFVMFSYFGGGHGASRESDGLNHGSNAISMATIAPVEVLEANFPVLFEQWALRPDSGGAGAHRGGLGSIYSVRLLTRQARAYFLGDRGKFAPFGVNGGGSAAKNELIFKRAAGDYLPPMVSKAVDVSLSRGDVVELRTPGGGGYGNPLKRPVSEVLLDLSRGYITPPAARELYGVALTPEGTLDEAETARLRSS